MSYNKRRWRRVQTNMVVENTGFYATKTHLLPGNPRHPAAIECRNLIWLGTGEIKPLPGAQPDRRTPWYGIRMRSWHPTQFPIWQSRTLAWSPSMEGRF